MKKKKKLPIILTFEIVQEAPPNAQWSTITGVLTWNEDDWEEGYTQRMEPALCTISEVERLKEDIAFLVGQTFHIVEVREVREKKERTTTASDTPRLEGRGLVR